MIGEIYPHPHPGHPRETMAIAFCRIWSLVLVVSRFLALSLQLQFSSTRFASSFSRTRYGRRGPNFWDWPILMRYRGEYLHDVNRLHHSLDEETFTDEGLLATSNSEKKIKYSRF
jgi:hypothetical protein